MAKGTGQDHKTEVVLPSDSVLRTLSKCPEITEGQEHSRF